MMPVSKNKRKRGKWKSKRKPSAKNNIVYTGRSAKYVPKKNFDKHNIIDHYLNQILPQVVKKNPDGTFSIKDDKDI